MEIVKAFNSNNLHTEIVIKGTINEPLFRASDIGVVLEMGNIRSTTNDFDDTEKIIQNIETAGGIQQVTFLTEKGLYKILFRSRKTIAQQFQNWVCEVIKEIRLTGVYDLQKQLEKQQLEQQQIEDKTKQEYEVKLKQQQILDREQILLKEFATAGPLFYLIKIKTLENGQYIIKFGESRRGIIDRYKEHKNKYDECLLLDCFTVNRSKDFETFIKEHEVVRPNKVTNLIGHEREQELLLVGKNLTYKMLIDIINNNLKYFDNEGTYKLELENQKLKMLIEMAETNNSNILIQELTKTVILLNNKIDNLEQQNKKILEKLNSDKTKITTGFNQQLPTIGPRLQKINPETSQLIKVYETVTEAMNENKNIKRPSIMKAIQENTIYCGFRWQLVERNLDPNNIYDLQPTKVTKIQNLGYIAKLRSDKSEILNVYLDRKTAALENGYSSSSALDNPVKNNIISKGFYYCLYNNCSNELTSKFEENNGTPILYKDGVGQFNEENELVNEFTCKYDCIKSLNISDKTLAKSLDKDILYNGFYYKSLGSKLFI
jgi:prophage antirepressor-like protein